VVSARPGGLGINDENHRIKGLIGGRGAATMAEAVDATAYQEADEASRGLGASSARG